MKHFIIDLESEDNSVYEKESKNIMKVKVQDTIYNKRVVMYMSKEAMISFGVELIKQAHNDFEFTHEHIDPISEFMCSSSMGVYLSTDSDELLILPENFQTIEEEKKKARYKNKL